MELTNDYPEKNIDDIISKWDFLVIFPNDGRTQTQRSFQINVASALEIAINQLDIDIPHTLEGLNLVVPTIARIFRNITYGLTIDTIRANVIRIISQFAKVLEETKIPVEHPYIDWETEMVAHFADNYKIILVPEITTNQ